ncbi:MAG TPA: hypothetical protein VHS27_12605 [Gaiellales bacterium]|jgi:hypothetical protein|nr:hypothetical protein [Gaiellales bacterium]
MSPEAATNLSRLQRWAARWRKLSGTSFEVRVAVLLAAAAIVAGVIGARRDDFAGGASGDWSRAVRLEVKRSLATTSADQLIYGTTVPNVAQLQEATVQAKAYLAELGSASGLTAAERDALGVRARIEYTRSIALARTTVADARYFGADHYSRFDLGRALLDERRDSVRGVEDPVRVQAGGDRLSRFSIADGVAEILVAVVVLLASVAVALGAKRPAVLRVAAAVLVVSVAVSVAVELAQ